MTMCAIGAMNPTRRRRQGPSMKGVFKRPYLPLSGLPANDERVGEIIRFGRSKMPDTDRR